MFRPFYSVLISMGILASATSPAGAAEWGQYQNARFGTVADIPLAGFIANPASDNGDGQAWVSADGAGQILVFGTLIVTSGTIADYRRETLGFARDEGLDIIYNVANRNWFAYSGYLGDDIIYEKVIVTRACGGMIGNHVYFRYPASQKAAYGPIVARVASSLRGSENAIICN